jgi:2-amino-4-hydroxy-6-hydroxymethyldihydropteridine diphosphokinase
LLYDDEKIESEELTVPHPRIKDRSFVLCPLKDLFEDEKFNSFDFSLALKNVDKNTIIAIL